MRASTLLTGTVLGLGLRAALDRVIKSKFDSDVARLNAGDHSTLLRAYSDDAVLRFNEGDHRWAGTWIGKPNIDRFLQNFTAARIQGRIREIATSGPPWALTMWVRFDDHADGPDGERIYENRTVLVLRTRWGKVVEQDDFYEDTERISALDGKLADLGVTPVPKAGVGY